MAPIVCAHKRWRIETPNGPKVRGWCKSCGTTRLYDTVPNPPPEWEKGPCAWNMHKHALEAKLLRVEHGELEEGEE